MQFKEGVKVFGVRPEIAMAMLVVYQVYNELDNAKNCVITSVIDGKHKRGSDHYAGLAFDVRVWGFSDKQRAQARDMVDDRLTDEFEVFDETDHLHVGFDPQKGLD